MVAATFKDWTLTKLDKTFGLRQIWECELLKEWENNTIKVEEADKIILLKLQKSLIRGGRSWNETELENKFISPLIMTADIDDEEIGYFLERNLSHVIGEYELSGTVDGMIATGFRDPDIPLFCLHEYKRSVENQGSPEAQVLAAMLVAREKNNNKLPIYGLFVVGLVWNFIVLNHNEYCISIEYTASNGGIFDIFRMVKRLKQIIKNELVELYKN
ncbi:MAG: hypothetical protein KDK90_21270 [Leptospiraceae bacterium]|nr:hypothetical protein [Leptospiraceae bacterium]